MKQIKTKFGSILVIEVPEDSENFILHDNDGITYDSLSTNTIKNPWGFIDLEKGWYEILGKLSELTDKDCEKFVEKEKNIKNPFQIGKDKITYFKDYYSIAFPKIFESAKESFISLLQSEGIDTSKEQLIIKIL